MSKAGPQMILVVVLGLALLRAILPLQSVFGKEQYHGCLTILYDSRACPCIQDRNREIQETVNHMIQKAIIDTSLIKYITYDYSNQPQLVDSLLNTTSEGFLPVLILKSCDNILYYESSFILDTVRFQQGLSDFMMIHKRE